MNFPCYSEYFNIGQQTSFFFIYCFQAVPIWIFFIQVYIALYPVARFGRIGVKAVMVGGMLAVDNILLNALQEGFDIRQHQRQGTYWFSRTNRDPSQMKLADISSSGFCVTLNSLLICPFCVGFLKYLNFGTEGDCKKVRYSFNSKHQHLCWPLSICVTVVFQNEIDFHFEIRLTLRHGFHQF